MDAILGGLSMIDEVVTALREVADELVVPRFRNLAEGDITEKAPGDLVTIVDRETEVVLGKRLANLLHGSLVVGEEAVAADHRVLERIGDPGPVWVIDPIDGTGNFAAGREPFALMVALLRGGRPVLSVIYQPISGLVAAAESGSGTYIDGERMTLDHTPLRSEDLVASVHIRYLPETLREQVKSRLPRLGKILPSRHCAGHDYPELIKGGHHVILYWRSLPWDHAPGALMVREAGGVVRHFDGAQYDPALPHPGLLVCRDDEVYALARRTLLE
jgi:fructose-1,6-bisphosphatase/inositol monophosphatase family enzyme